MEVEITEHEYQGRTDEWLNKETRGDQAAELQYLYREL